ncbi:MAG: gephyrin-like molybdotransferase Glp [Candidatus Bathyarchaeota archaeon]
MNNTKMQGFMKLTRVDVALKQFFQEIKVESLPVENTPTFDALGRVLAEDIVAEVNVPRFDRSAVDGYALSAKGTFGASRLNPVIFDFQGSVEIGSSSKISIGTQHTVRIATGAPIPPGVDSVVMIEDTEKIARDKVEVYKAVTPGENISRKGEDVKIGEKILSRGLLLQPQDLGILAALERSRVNVVRQPRVATLSTGNELVELGKSPEEAQIIDSNRPIIMAMVKELGGTPVDLGIVKDDLEEIRSVIAGGVKTCDLVLVSGGTSVGAGDLVPEAILGLEKSRIIVHGISIRPGRPSALAAVGKKPVVLLPGFPVAAMVSFTALVQPILTIMLGTTPTQFQKKTVQAKMLRRVPSSIGNKTFARVIVTKVGKGYVAEPFRTSGSGVISSMIRANGLVVISEDKEGLEEGEEVEITLLRPVEA